MDVTAVPSFLLCETQTTSSTILLARCLLGMMKGLLSIGFDRLLLSVFVNIIVVR